jgi:coproporphyrinogen III oxidase-like Fe-S oxidoreductase
MRFSDPTDIMNYINWVNNNVEIAKKRDAAWKPSGDAEYIGNDEAMSEYMILGLRLTEGISSSEFSERFGASLKAVYGDKLDKLMKEGLIEAFRKTDQMSGFAHDKNGTDETDCCYRLTRIGLDLANRAFVEFI